MDNVIQKLKNAISEATSFIACVSQRFSKNVMIEPKCWVCKNTPLNCGVAIVVLLVLFIIIF